MSQELGIQEKGVAADGVDVLVCFVTPFSSRSRALRKSGFPADVAQLLPGFYADEPLFLATTSDEQP